MLSLRTDRPDFETERMDKQNTPPCPTRVRESHTCPQSAHRPSQWSTVLSTTTRIFDRAGSSSHFMHHGNHASTSICARTHPYQSSSNSRIGCTGCTLTFLRNLRDWQRESSSRYSCKVKMAPLSFCNLRACFKTLELRGLHSRAPGSDAARCAN